MITGTGEYIPSIVESQTSNLDCTGIANLAFSFVPLPERSTFGLGIAGLAGLGSVALRKKFRRGGG